MKTIYGTKDVKPRVLVALLETAPKGCIVRCVNIAGGEFMHARLHRDAQIGEVVELDLGVFSAETPWNVP